MRGMWYVRQSLEKEYKKQHAVYTQRLKRYEKSIRKERTKKAKQNSATLVSDVRSDVVNFLPFYLV